MSGDGTEKPAGPQPHRCNDRIEDFLQAWGLPSSKIFVNRTGRFLPMHSRVLILAEGYKGASVVLQALFTMEVNARIVPAWRQMWSCIRSKAG